MFEHLRFEGGTFFWLGIAGVKEAGIILRPPDLHEARPADLVIEDPAGVDIHHAYGPPIGAAFLDGVGEIAAVMRDRPFGKRGCPVLGPAVGVDYNAIRSVLADIQDGLRLQTGASDEEITVAALFRRDRKAFVVGKRLEALLEQVATGKRGEVVFGQIFLLSDPGLNLPVAANAAFQPAIRVGNRCAEMRVDGFGALGGPARELWPMPSPTGRPAPFATNAAPRAWMKIRAMKARDKQSHEKPLVVGRRSVAATRSRRIEVSAADCSYRLHSRRSGSCLQRSQRARSAMT